MKSFLSLTRLLSVFLFLLSIIVCEGNTMNLEKIKFSTIESVSEKEWQELSKKKIFFGHQSVGNNIIKGISTLKKEHPVVTLNLQEGRDSNMFSNGVFAHDKIGSNHDPISKVDDFYAVIKGNGSPHIDIVFFKFCFVDIDSASDVNAIFNYYHKKMTQLKEIFPETLFIHFTVPLLRAEKNLSISSLKKILKKSLGKKSNHILDNEHNIARNKFKSLLLSEYEGKEPVFDLAKVESTYSNGELSTFSSGGATYYSLVPEYTKDGGHLNEIGQKVVAEKLLIFLANLSAPSTD